MSRESFDVLAGFAAIARERKGPLPDHPELRIEIIVDYGLTDIVAEDFDAGVRMNEQVTRDMIAVRIGPDIRMAVVGAPAYFARDPPPASPHDLTAHNCTNMRLPTYGGVIPWSLEAEGREVNVRGEGQLVFNNLALRLSSALDGLGLAFLLEDQAAPFISDGRLQRVLAEWCPPFPGYHLYYPSRNHSPADAAGGNAAIPRAQSSATLFAVRRSRNSLTCYDGLGHAATRDCGFDDHQGFSAPRCELGTRSPG